ncbi:hypothetical protein IWX47DRAFT_114199 [Phyllosticta citricarpa]
MNSLCRDRGQSEFETRGTWSGGAQSPLCPGEEWTRLLWLPRAHPFFSCGLFAWFMTHNKAAAPLGSLLCCFVTDALSHEITTHTARLDNGELVTGVVRQTVVEYRAIQESFRLLLSASIRWGPVQRQGCARGLRRCRVNWGFRGASRRPAKEFLREVMQPRAR